MTAAHLSLLALFAGHVCAETIEGKVDLPKTVSAPVVAKRYEVVSKGGVLSTNPPLAVVYLSGSFPRRGSLPMKQVVQRDLTFLPGLLPIEVGTRVEFPNQDDTFHNIFSFSPAKRFDLGRYRPDERPIPSQLFDVPGLVSLRCDIHEHMHGIILVLETPYFVMTDAAGNYRLTGLPPGSYTLKAWLNSRSTLEHPVQIKSGSALHINFP